MTRSSNSTNGSRATQWDVRHAEEVLGELSLVPVTIPGLSERLRLELWQVRRGLSFLHDGGEVELDPNGVWSTVGLDGARRIVLNLLVDGAKRPDTLEELGVGGALILLKKLQSEGFARVTAGQYFLTEAGKRAVGAQRASTNLELWALVSAHRWGRRLVSRHGNVSSIRLISSMWRTE